MIKLVSFIKNNSRLNLKVITISDICEHQEVFLVAEQTDMNLLQEDAIRRTLKSVLEYLKPPAIESVNSISALKYFLA